MLSDSKCSREHAIIRIVNGAASVEDLKSQNGILVNGAPAASAFLNSGSKIQIGSTVLEFYIVSQLQSQESTGPSSLGLSPKKKNKSKKTFYIILGTVVALFLYLLNNPTNDIAEEFKGSSIDEEIESSIQRQEALLKSQNQTGIASRQYLDAHASYMKGLRDYREGYYKSAFVSFNAALAIYPNHQLARRYIRLAQNKLDEQIQLLMNEGNRAMEENKYHIAQSAFKNVLILVGDPQSKIFKEAKEKMNECNLLLRESF